MEYLIRIDPRSVKKNITSDAIAVYGKKTISRTVTFNKLIDGNNYGHTEKFIASGVNADNTLVNPVMVSQEIVPYPIQEGMTTQITQDAQMLHAVGRQPRFTYKYLPTMVRCCKCEEEFPHTELREDYNDWDYHTGCPSEFCDTICRYCGEWWCCDIEWEKLSDDALEKIMTRGINQVVIE
jgi:hypothetical protein